MFYVEDEIIESAPPKREEVFNLSPSNHSEESADEFVASSTMVITIRKSQLGKFLGGRLEANFITDRIDKDDLAPFCVILHPGSFDEAVVVYRPRSMIHLYNPTTLNYRVYSFALDGH